MPVSIRSGQSVRGWACVYNILSELPIWLRSWLGDSVDSLHQKISHSPWVEVLELPTWVKKSQNFLFGVGRLI